VADRYRPRAALDVYLFPAVVGGGVGDVAEVFDAGAWLRAAGFSPVLYRPPGRAMPPSVEGPWSDARVRRMRSLRPTAPRALTITPNWGVTAAPGRAGRLVRPGPWAVEAQEVESHYGPDRTLHVSLEEFARTLSSRAENAERWREGGRRGRAIAKDRASAEFARDARTFHEAFREFRGFDRPNVLHLFQTFAPSVSFSREFPEAVQVGPIWPRRRTSGPTDPRRWVWYASPSSSERIVADIDAGLRGTPVRTVLLRSPRPLPLPTDSPLRWRLAPPMSSSAWSRAFDRAGLRIVTGSRTLLEALALGRPFLYYNGTMGDGSRRHRHRPEKVQALLAAWRRAGVPAKVRKDISDFSRGRRVASVVRSAAMDPSWRRAWPLHPIPESFPAERADGGRYLGDLAREFAEGRQTAAELVGLRRTVGTT
jgi:hypothetical protein